MHAVWSAVLVFFIWPLLLLTNSTTHVLLYHLYPIPPSHSPLHPPPSGAMAIASLARLEPNREKLGSSGACEIVLNGFKNHPSQVRPPHRCFSRLLSLFFLVSSSSLSLFSLSFSFSFTFAFSISLFVSSFHTLVVFHLICSFIPPTMHTPRPRYCARWLWPWTCSPSPTKRAPSSQRTAPPTTSSGIIRSLASLLGVVAFCFLLVVKVYLFSRAFCCYFLVIVFSFPHLLTPFASPIYPPLTPHPPSYPFPPTPSSPPLSPHLIPPSPYPPQPPQRHLQTRQTRPRGRRIHPSPRHPLPLHPRPHHRQVLVRKRCQTVRQGPPRPRSGGGGCSLGVQCGVRVVLLDA